MCQPVDVPVLIGRGQHRLVGNDDAGVPESSQQLVHVGIFQPAHHQQPRFRQGQRRCFLCRRGRITGKLPQTAGILFRLYQHRSQPQPTCDLLHAVRVGNCNE